MVADVVKIVPPVDTVSIDDHSWHVVIVVSVCWTRKMTRLTDVQGGFVVLTGPARETWMVADRLHVRFSTCLNHALGIAARC